MRDSHAAGKTLPGAQERPRLRLTPLTPKQAAKLARPKEVQVQCGYVAWCRRMQTHVPELARVFHVPNGEQRDVRTAAKLSRMGVRAGVLDIWLPVPRRGFHGASFDLKRPDEKPTPEQWYEMAILAADGYATAYFDEWLDAADWTLWYLGRKELSRALLAHMERINEALAELEAQLR